MLLELFVLRSYSHISEIAIVKELFKLANKVEFVSYWENICNLDVVVLNSVDLHEEKLKEPEFERGNHNKT